MNLGTIVYENEIYNLDYMEDEEIKQIIDNIEDKKRENINEMKNIRQNQK